MNEHFIEMTQISPFAGNLYLETVAGETSRKIEHENDVQAADGQERTMYAYAPKSGCPDAKQTQILMVLRDGSDEASAEAILRELELDALAEQEHILILMPNPAPGGWNYRNDITRDNDMDFLMRCFGALRGSKLGVNGFNGMIYYLAASEDASALLMSMASRRPLNVPAMMIGPFPSDYAIPTDALYVETAACVFSNPVAEAYLKTANGVSTEETDGEMVVYYGENPNVRLAVTQRTMDAAAVRICWKKVLNPSRRWQNDTHGTYQKRTDFLKRGFTAHIKDKALGCNDGYAHTWYEYIPPQLRGTQEKVPLVFYFHGVNCVPLYGAEQSGWHEIADRENLIVVYPAPAVAKAWNIYNDPSMPSDFAFVMALIEHMKTVHPIDETRIYATGFSMGAMMTHALCGAYPDVFAAGAPCNAYDMASFVMPKALYKGAVQGVDSAGLAEDPPQRKLAEQKWGTKDYRMPMIQNVGMNDSIIGAWPVTEITGDVRDKTLDRWMRRNNIPREKRFDSGTLSGLAADESFYEDPEQRFFHQRWCSDDPGHPVLFEQIIAKRMPHAVLPKQIGYAWQFIRKFRRMKDGSLKIEEM